MNEESRRIYDECHSYDDYDDDDDHSIMIIRTRFLTPSLIFITICKMAELPGAKCCTAGTIE